MVLILLELHCLGPHYRGSRLFVDSLTSREDVLALILEKLHHHEPAEVSLKNLSRGRSLGLLFAKHLAHELSELATVIAGDW